jgi:HEAT repeat protein
MRFRFPDIDAFSFWLGIILASLSWWILSMVRPALQQMHATAQAKHAKGKEKKHATTSVEERYRQSVLRQAQGLHLAAPLFSLDEIIIPPTLLAPPPRVEPGVPILSEDIVAATIPYIPTWPELAAIYQAPTLTLAQALSGNSDIVLTGQTGMGKTVALAYLASRLARRDPEPGLPLDTVPFLIHVADLDLPVKVDEPLNPVIDLIAEKAPVLDLARLPDFVRKTFLEGRALLLLDGTDELTPDGLKNAVEFIKAVKRAYPKTRMVTTASSEFLDGLVTLNFIPFALAGWNARQRRKFTEKWANLWTNFVAVESWAQISEQVDPLVLNGWLDGENYSLTPLELTLKTWGAYAGDMRGSSPLDAIDTHLRRLSPSNVSLEAFEMLALQVTLTTEPIFDPRIAREWIKSFEPPEIANAPEVIDETGSKKSDKVPASSLGLITKMVESGLLTQHRNNRMRFIHPVFSGYLAGKAFINYKSEALLDQPPWIGKYLALHFLAALGDATPLVEKLLSMHDRPLSRNLLVPARWLRDAPRQMVWRGQVMAKLVELLQQTGQPLSLRGQALCAFVLSGDPGAIVLLRQFLEEHDDYELLQLVALGSGALQDTKSIELLSDLLNKQNPNVRRAACLALVNIGSTTAMDIVASALLHGDENLRRAAAEALANHPGEGHAMLKEGAGLKEDLLVRRSVAFGLGRIPEPWAKELIDHLQTDDDQWAVRNAAMAVNEERQRPNPHIPQRLPPPTESPWIIAFAGKQGLGVSPDKPPIDLLLLALKSGTEEERMASLAYLRIMPVEGVFGALYHAMYGGEPTLREAVFQTFSEMAARGVDVPDPVQFGVGS